MQRRLLRLLLTTVPAAALVVTTLSPPAVAAPAAETGTPSPSSPSMLAALQRDLGLTPEQAETRLAAEARAAKIDQHLRAELGDAHAGSWMNDAGSRLVVAVTESADVGTVREAGALAKVVTHDGAELDAVKAKLDRRAAAAPEGVSSWYVDVMSNSVVVLAHGYAIGSAERFVARSGAAGDAVRVVESTERPRPLYDVRGGDAYYISSGSRCSIGFSVQGGFITAGHCGSRGATTTGSNRVAQGTFQGSSFPGNDYAWVQVNSNWTPRPVVNDYSGGTVSVKGANEAPVNASVCRSGSTTGWHCGRITARNSSVTYPQGRVDGLIRTTVCAEPGDSGGSLVTADRNNAHAQGVTSGGSGNCSSGGTTYFQPVPEILSTYGLRLLTEGGGDPDPPGDACENYESSYTGSLSSGARQYQPDGSWYYSAGSGTHAGCLDAPNGTDFDLYLQKWSGSAWNTVSESTSPGPDETVNYNGTSGYYRYQVHAYSGSGAYSLGVNTP
ncbi:streptogrisin C [Amycolatopsis marina]|uniref:Streptogrisin C n=1 Tax=Amycolatopsis marina TaxID=490629 RepID=A0A1I1CMM4_9PSEU|nr:S1 family peptidase [Amycolatopsis marina]SFB63955.1 streptogrisin C [Amycolatopsis marina]